MIPGVTQSTTFLANVTQGLAPVVAGHSIGGGFPFLLMVAYRIHRIYVLVTRYQETVKSETTLATYLTTAAVNHTIEGTFLDKGTRPIAKAIYVASRGARMVTRFQEMTYRSERLWKALCNRHVKVHEAGFSETIRWSAPVSVAILWDSHTEFAGQVYVQKVAFYVKQVVVCFFAYIASVFLLIGSMVELFEARDLSLIEEWDARNRILMNFNETLETLEKNKPVMMDFLDRYGGLVDTFFGEGASKQLKQSLQTNIDKCSKVRQVTKATAEPVVPLFREGMATLATLISDFFMLSVTPQNQQAAASYEETPSSFCCEQPVVFTFHVHEVEKTTTT